MSVSEQLLKQLCEKSDRNYEAIGAALEELVKLIAAIEKIFQAQSRPLQTPVESSAFPGRSIPPAVDPKGDFRVQPWEVLSNRAWNVINSIGCWTLAHLEAKTEQDIIDAPRAGIKTVNEIRHYVKQAGGSFAAPEPK